MRVADILQTKGSQVWTIQAGSTVYEALGSLVQHKIGALIVTGEGGNVAGILSERDIIRACYSNTAQIERIVIDDIMTRNVIVASPEDDVEYVMGIMTNNRIRHLPIIADAKLAGIISIGDVVKAQLQDTRYENHYLRDYIYGPGASKAP